VGAVGPVGAVAVVPVPGVPVPGVPVPGVPVSVVEVAAVVVGPVSVVAVSAAPEADAPSAVRTRGVPVSAVAARAAPARSTVATATAAGTSGADAASAGQGAQTVTASRRCDGAPAQTCPVQPTGPSRATRTRGRVHITARPWTAADAPRAPRRTGPGSGTRRAANSSMMPQAR